MLLGAQSQTAVLERRVLRHAEHPAARLSGPETRTPSLPGVLRSSALVAQRPLRPTGVNKVFNARCLGREALGELDNIHG